ncbi:type IV pilus modification protein PilV [Entomomonas asaccharolytica]|uniref:Type IV pilus modification protein PilV n=1 Tax=Entomomonas asaccharolytica TaxID=2785331 RepID=A0A974NE83_9GAMM|nr:type IV pilus modification protein PilV [Entomomonas asaccharolytica]QQP85155.1 type IV pilus modification protein PilV [Entomomonas asaccharolytica]
MIKVNTQRGFSILEVLIAFVILVIGILGASILIIRSSQVNVKAYETEQIALMANTFIEKIRVNPTNIDEYLKKVGSKKSACQGLGKWCSGADMAVNDIYNFNEQISGLAVQNVTWDLELSKSDIMGVPDNKRYKLSITWDTARELGQASDSSTVGSYYSYFIVNTAL